MSAEVFLGYFTGLRLLDDQITFQTLVYSSAFVHLIDAILCRIVAGQKNLSQNLWMVFGLLFGIWAVLSVAFFPAPFPNLFGRFTWFRKNAPSP